MGFAHTLLTIRLNKMNIEFIKAHFSGIKEGHVTKVDDKFGARMIEEGYAKEVGNSDSKPSKEVKSNKSKKKVKK